MYDELYHKLDSIIKKHRDVHIQSFEIELSLSNYVHKLCLQMTHENINECLGKKDNKNDGIYRRSHAI